ncbi:MAG: hypothetical protein GW878_03745, partial [Acidobacteria bacterium]|nr:hypothetical protein [Acidobacteriota bacterium]
MYACISGFLFFLLGLFVLLSRPPERSDRPSQVFFTLCTLFLLLLVCRLREPSYSSFDWVVLTTGTLSLLVLPAAFLHFFLVFPRRLRISFRDLDSPAGPASLLAGLEHFVNDSPNLVRLLYLVPPLFYVSSLVLASLFEVQIRLVFLAPISSWVLMGDYFVLGLLALLASMLKSKEGRERRQIGWVFVGTVLGVTPFLLFAVVLPSVWGTDQFVAWGVIPLALVPLTFAYAVVRFQFFDIKVIVRRSLLYTVTTAIVSVAYALGIAAVNLIFRDSLTGRSPLFFLIMALAIVALFDPLRRRLQGPVDRFFFREAYDARLAIEEVSAALVREFSFAGLEKLLVERLEAIMHLEWAVLYRCDGGAFESQAVAPPLPAALPADLAVLDVLA